MALAVEIGTHLFDLKIGHIAKPAAWDTYADEVEGVMACPAGINILRGDAIDRPQEELRLLISDRRLAFNINTREELAAVKSLLGDR